MNENDLSTPLRVVTSCRSRFHIFDQARELYRNNALYRLIHDYPSFYPVKFGIPKTKLESLILLGIVYHSLANFRLWLPQNLRNTIARWIHNNFSKKVIQYIPADTQYFIGLSSFSLEALKHCRSQGILCAVDHGSLHQTDEKRFVEEEAKRWNLTVSVDTAPKWVIEKENLEFKTADNVFVLSSVARDSLVRNGIPENKIFINPLGVDLRAFYPGKKTDNVFRVIQVGNITLGKGVLTLIDAFKRANVPNSELWFVGGGLSAYGLQDKINELSSPNIIFHPPVPQAQLQEYYARSSVAVLASVADGFGMVVPQAMACGLPIIVTENVGAKDLITNGINGFIVPIASPDMIAEKLKSLAANPDLCKKIGEAAKDSVTKGFSWESYGYRLTNFIRAQVNK